MINRDKKDDCYDDDNVIGAAPVITMLTDLHIVRIIIDTCLLSENLCDRDKLSG